VKFLLFTGILLANLFFFSGKEEHEIRYMNNPSVEGDVAKVVPVYTDFQDTIVGDTLYLEFTSKGLPRSARRKISTGVCIDGQCRKLQMSVYWDITGRYLGFELPPGEFLSKTEHEPFNDKEYKQLHTLLADPYSPLANYTLEELVPPTKQENKAVDAVSSATVKEVLNSVVEGAVYTSYTLWHIVYGNSQKEVKKLGLHYFSEELAMHILENQDSDSRIWALNNLQTLNEWSDSLQQKVLGLIGNQNFYLSERAINSFNSELLNSADFQRQIYSVFERSEYSVKRLIITKLSKATVLSDELKDRLAAGLPGYNGPLAQNVLDLFIQYRVDDVPTCLQISELLADKNKFLARKAFNYLDQLSIEDGKIKKRMKAYKQD